MESTWNLSTPIDSVLFSNHMLIPMGPIRDSPIEVADTKTQPSCDETPLPESLAKSTLPQRQVPSSHELETSENLEVDEMQNEAPDRLQNEPRNKLREDPQDEPQTDASKNNQGLRTAAGELPLKSVAEIIAKIRTPIGSNTFQGRLRNQFGPNLHSIIYALRSALFLVRSSLEIIKHGLNKDHLLTATILTREGDTMTDNQHIALDCVVRRMTSLSEIGRDVLGKSIWAHLLDVTHYAVLGWGQASGGLHQKLWGRLDNYPLLEAELENAVEVLEDFIPDLQALWEADGWLLGEAGNRSFFIKPPEPTPPTPPESDYDWEVVVPREPAAASEHDSMEQDSVEHDAPELIPYPPPSWRRRVFDFVMRSGWIRRRVEKLMWFLYEWIYENGELDQV
ncbi:uncharacterized protein BDZ99DRAFT_527845 [Mytilinidion resinicola]|uniref:Uncharacterized protein n=1 Tax=Mytilinidion resinicola TaxID=574789 RepID=A0A6A6Y048_9PEZI|nr:uncharacterized protein BDZ99DRAFT_527845 [Mytilinidion resinicola]KAF2802181.1 hypothetical protein BDZ99DRAFT_527845 [Mytilinidion resinicola]